MMPRIVQHNPSHICVYMPMRLESAGNIHRHWVKDHQKHAAQKMEVHAAFSWVKTLPEPPLTIVLRRCAPRPLDSEDNLRHAFKWVKDAIAEMFHPHLAPGRADEDKLLTWQYDQVQTKNKLYRVEVELIKHVEALHE